MKLPVARTRPAPRAAPAPQAPAKQADAPSQAGSGVRPNAAQLLSATGGVPLPGPVLQRMQRAFGTGFGRVKVHRGAEAEAFDAAAFTTGERIFLPKNAPPLSSHEGQALLSHELTHVLQQRSGRVRVKGGGVSVDPHPHLEQEAEAAGRAVMQGETPVVGSHPSGPRTDTSGGAAVQRLKEEDEGIELQPIAKRQGGEQHEGGEQHAAEAKPQGGEKHEGDAKHEGGEHHEGGEQHAAEVKHEGAEKHEGGEKPGAAHAKTEEKAEGEAAEGEAKEPPKQSRLVRGAKAVARLFADAGQGSGQPSLQQTDQQVMQNLGGSADLAKQAEQSGSAYPPAPDPMVDWAQPQPADPSAPPPLPIPDRPQPEQPASIQPDPPLAPSGGVQSRDVSAIRDAIRSAAKRAKPKAETAPKAKADAGKHKAPDDSSAHPGAA